MSTDIRRLVLALLGIVAAGVAVLALVTLANGGLGFAGCNLTTPLGWTIPLVSLFVILGVGWLLMSQAPKDDGAGPASTVACDACGRPVLEDWRLCPYCGAAPASERPLGSTPVSG